MMLDCSCGWAGSTAAFNERLEYCPDCGKKLTIRNSDEANDHYDYDCEDNDVDE